MRVTTRGVRTLFAATIAVVGGIAAIAATGSDQVPPPPPPPPPPPIQSGQAPTQSPTPAEPPKGTGILMGQIIDAASRKPIAGATVTITGGSTTTIVLPTGEILMGSPQGGGAPVPDAPRQILADAQGQFLFRSLAAGRYTIRASAPGYSGGVFGQSRPSGSAQAIELTRDDEKRADLVVRMWKSGSISGRIVDEAGEPIVDLSVRVYRREFSSGRLRLSATQSAYTDDRGMYRAANLLAGDYIVGISSIQSTMPVAIAEAYYQQLVTAGSSMSSDIYNSLSSSGASMVTSGYRVGELLLGLSNSGRTNSSGAAPPPNADGKVAVYSRRYFPSAATIPEAAIVTLASGQDRTGVDLQLKLVPTVRVSGVVTGPDGPAANLGLRLTPVDAESVSGIGSEGAATATDPSGAFTFLGVIPGQYTLSCLKVPRVQSAPTMTSSIEISGPNGMMVGMYGSSGPGNPAALPAQPTLFLTLPLTVAEADIHGLSLSLHPGIRITGKLVFEGSKDQPIADQLVRTSISVSLAGGAMSPSQLFYVAKKIETDGRFATMGYPPGRYTVSASIPSVPGGVAGWRFKSATLGGVNVDDGFEISETDISGLVITFTDRSTEVSGAVIDATGQPDRTASVVTIPADSQSWKQGLANGRRLRSTRTTTAGAFTIVDLPAGDYFIAAIPDEELENWQDPRTLEAITRVATRITLGDGEKKTETLRARSIR